MGKALCFARLFALVILFVTIAFSQTAQLMGALSDQSAAIVPGTRVTAINVGTGIARSPLSIQSGNPLITALLPGSHRVAAGATGLRQAALELLRLVDQVAHFGRNKRFNLQLRAEFFNVANHVQFGVPATVFGNAAFGVLSSQGNNPQTQLALKLQC